MCDDVFSDEEGAERSVPEENEWKRLQQARTADGYREGVERGENEKLQQGFNAGFCSAIKHSFQMAKLRGAVTALIGIHVTKQETLFAKSMNEQLEDLLQEIVSLEALIVSGSGTTISPENSQHESESRDSASTESCNTDSCCGGKCKTGDGTTAATIKVASRQSQDTAYGKKISLLEKQYKELLDEAGIDFS